MGPTRKELSSVIFIVTRQWVVFFTGCYPYYDKDPFILEKCPHVYFVGNQPKYESKVLDGNLTDILLSLVCFIVIMYCHWWAVTLTWCEA